MLRFSRTDDPAPDKKTRIVDGVGAKAWLAGMAQPASVENLREITQVLLALGALGVQDGTATLTPARKFAIAERIRGLLLQTLNDRNRGDRFAGLPLDDDFVTHFWTVADAASALRDVYAWLVSQLTDAPVLSESSVLPGEPPGVTSQASLVSGVGALHRALDVNAQLLTWIQRARWPVPAPMWERHCVLGQLVRDLDCQDIEVADALRASITKTCRAAFAMPVLVALADPAARGGTEFELVRMAAQRWSAKVGFRLERRADAAPAAGAAVPARPVANPGPTVMLGSYQVRFDTLSALASIDKRLVALSEGQTPREVGIGDGVRPEAARDLLLLLKQRWGAVLPRDIDSPDRSWRAAAPGIPVMALVGLPVAGGKRRDGSVATALRPGQRPYGGRSTHHDGITRPREQVESERLEALLHDTETWTLDAESSDAVRCIRRYPRPRIGLQRLIGLRLGTAGEAPAPLLMGWVEALQCAPLGEGGAPRPSAAHTVRVRLAPGLPQLLHASIDDVEVEGVFLLAPGGGATLEGRQPRAPAFVPMLSQPGLDPATFALREADGWEAVRASPREYGLILPAASFRLHRLVKAGRRGVVAMLRLEELMMRGADFDLVRFTPL